jgi:hypothetical protein
MKNFVKAMNKHGMDFECLGEKFLELSDATLKYGIFIGPQILKIINDYPFKHPLKETKKSAWLAFEGFCLNFLGNVKAENYMERAEILLNAYQTMGCNNSLKIHFLRSHMEFSPPNLGAVSDESRERFRQNISTLGKSYAGKS